MCRTGVKTHGITTSSSSSITALLLTDFLRGESDLVVLRDFAGDASLSLAEGRVAALDALPRLETDRVGVEGTAGAILRFLFGEGVSGLRKHRFRTSAYGEQG